MRSETPKSILFLVDSYFPGSKSSAKLVHDLAWEAVRMGHRAVVMAPSEELEKAASIKREENGRFTEFRVRLGRLKGSSNFVRAINEWRMPYVMWNQGAAFFRENPCDLIVSYAPSIFWGPLVKRLKVLWGCPAYLILRDIFPQWAVDAGVLRENGLPHRLLKWVERNLYAQNDVIGVQSPANLKYFNTYPNRGNSRLEVLYNWMDTLESAGAVTDFRKQWNLEDKVVFFYGGNIGVAQDMDNILRLAENMRADTGAHFLMVGEGSEVRRLKQIIEEKSLKNVSIYPAVDQDTYMRMVAEFDVGLISLDKGLKTQNFPGKMLGYMYNSKPILASINPGNDLKDVMESAGVGRVALNGEDERLLAFAKELSGDASLRREMGARSRQLLENTFSARSAARKILDLVTPAKSAPVFRAKHTQPT